MVEIHGWITLKLSLKNEEIENERAAEEKLFEDIQRYIFETLKPTSRVYVAVKQLNWQYHIALSANFNHNNIECKEIKDLYHYVSERSPGSYGILYIYNDENKEHPFDFEVYVLRRGMLMLMEDPFLSHMRPRSWEHMEKETE